MNNREHCRRSLAALRQAMLVSFIIFGRLYGSAQSSLPGKATRAIAAYALTSAHNEEGTDPANWQLLGSNDEGQSWATLDHQTNQVFTARCQRRVFTLRNRTSYNIYRLKIQSEGAPEGTHLGEFELLRRSPEATNDGGIYGLVTSSQEHPLAGPASNAFDGDPTTRWRDFGAGQPGGCWLQCQYTFEAALAVTNANQISVMNRQVNTHQELSDRVPQILANIQSQLTNALYALSGYALTSANDKPERDPRDWRLLGSNDDGKTWSTLDARKSELFATRLQRRIFTLSRPAKYAMYRLQIDSVRVPGIAIDGRSELVSGGANSVQIAEIEPLQGTVLAGLGSSVVVSAKGENPPIESTDLLFDGDSRTKWLDYARSDTNRSSWIQWHYIAGEKTPVINLLRLRNVRQQPHRPLELQLEGIAVAWDANAQTLGFLDETGFQILRFDRSIEVSRLGDRIQLSGRLELGRSFPKVVNPQLKRLSPLPAVSKVLAKQAYEPGHSFINGVAEGRVISISEEPFATTLRLTPFNSSETLLVKILNLGQVRPPALLGCRLKVNGVVQTVFNELGDKVAGTIWVSDLSKISLELPTDEEWNRWPEYSNSGSDSLRAHPLFRHPVRLRGTLVEQQPGQIVANYHGTNQWRIDSSETPTVPIGSPIEAVGFLGEEGSTPVLTLGQYRTAGNRPPLNLDLATTRDIRVASTIGEMHALAQAHPGFPIPVRVRGVITYLDPLTEDFYLQNGADAVRVSDQFSAGLSPTLQQEGSYIELEGIFEGADPPMITPKAFAKILGQGQMPEATRHPRDYLMTGADDNRWVEIEGLVREVGERRLVLAVSGGSIAVSINEMDKAAQARLLGSFVRASGVCLPWLNNRNQRLGIRLMVPALQNVETLSQAPENPFGMPTIPINRVLRSEVGSSSLNIQYLKTAGVVTYQSSRLLFIQDDGAGVRVLPRDDFLVQLGDRVEVVGVAEPDGFSAKISQAAVRRLGPGSLPGARAIDLLGTQLDDQDTTRGFLTGTFLGAQAKESHQLLEFQSEHKQQTFYAFLSTNQGVLPPIPIGSKVRLLGVFKAENDPDPDRSPTGASFAMYLNSPADLTIVKRPTWWNLQHTVWMLVGVAVVLFGALSWVGLLRHQVHERTLELHEQIEERKRMEFQVEKTHKSLLQVSRQAGMADVATNVLHNVGNVLNSVNVSAALVSEKIRRSKAGSLSKAATLLTDPSADLTTLLIHDPKGKQLPSYLTKLGEYLVHEQNTVLNELESLQKNVAHINEIVAMQQSYAKVSGVSEIVNLRDLIEDALRLNANSCARHAIETIREFAPVPNLTIEKHKVLQILVNLIRNAENACAESGRPDKRFTVRLTPTDTGLSVSVSDNGVGISAENLTHIFGHGFTTRKDGHGFGLHSGALAAKEMGGALEVHSPGVGLGATFTLHLPLIRPEPSPRSAATA